MSPVDVNYICHSRSKGCAGGYRVPRSRGELAFHSWGHLFGLCIGRWEKATCFTKRATGTFAHNFIAENKWNRRINYRLHIKEEVSSSCEDFGVCRSSFPWTGGGPLKSTFLASPSPRSGGGPGEMFPLFPAFPLLRTQQPLQAPLFSGGSAPSDPGFTPYFVMSCLVGAWRSNWERGDGGAGTPSLVGMLWGNLLPLSWPCGEPLCTRGSLCIFAVVLLPSLAEKWKVCHWHGGFSHGVVEADVP